MKIICKQCGREFELTDGEKAFYEGKGLSLPKRCPQCRAENKKNKTKANSSSTRAVYSINAKTVKPGSNKGKVKVISIVLAVVAVLTALVMSNKPGDSSSTTYVIENPVTAYSTDIASERYLDEEAATEFTTDAVTEQYSSERTVTEYSTKVTSKQSVTEKETEPASASYHFRNSDRLYEHYEKHGIEMGFSSAEAYEAAAAKVITNPNALTKYEAEDGDEVYFIERTGEIVFVAPGNIIRTYFIADMDYFNRQ